MSNPVIVRGPTQRAFARRLVDVTPQGWIIDFREPTRTDIQNRKLWPMCEDLAEQAVWPINGRKLNKHQWKDAAVGLSRQMRGIEQDAVPSPEGGYITIGGGSSKLTVAEFSHLIEVLYMLGDQQGVRWSEPRERGAA